MTKRNYHTEVRDLKNSARAILTNQPISRKYAIEFSREIKGMSLKKAEAFIKDVADMKRHLPLKKYVRRMGHRKGTVSGTKLGRWPVRCANKFLELLDLVKANADYKGLDTDKLVIADIFMSQGYQRRSHQKQGRISGKQYKRKSVHMEIVVIEGK
jgi:large subunit ribosomal protein L22